MKTFGLNLGVKKLANLFLAIFFSAFFWSCDSGDSSPKALLNVILIDAPAQWDSVFMEVEGVDIELQVQGRESENQTFFLPYSLGDKRIEVSALVAGNGLLLGRQELPAGKIISATFRIGESHSLFLDGERYVLPLANSGLNEIPVELEIDLEQGVAYDLILDIDLEKSIRVLSESPLSMELDPVLKATAGIGSGEIKGSISPTTLRPAIYAIISGDSVNTHINSSGNFSLRLQSGIYTIYIDPKDDRYQPELLENVEVLSGKSTDLTRITIIPK